MMRQRPWKHRAHSVALFFGLVMGAESGSLAAQAPADASRVDTFRVTMPELRGRQRTVRVYLPPGYDGSDRAYSVLYLQDGQNLFTPGAYGDWRVDETVDSLVAAGKLDGLIVVGIDNGERRWDEYGPWPNAQMHRWVDPSWSRETEGGDGAAYLDFLLQTLKPEIDRRYRTLQGVEHTGIGGSSMGGLIALYAGLVRPDVFGRVLAMSPAVWFAEGGGPWLSDNRLIGRIRGRTPPSHVRFYVDMGTDERSRETEPDVTDSAGRAVSYPRAYLEGARAVADAFRTGGVPEANLRYVVDQGAVHHESAWARRLADALLWLYR